MKLVDGLTGERSIYKRRGEKEPDVSFPYYSSAYLIEVLSSITNWYVLRSQFTLV